jgi:hypothetical protein
MSVLKTALGKLTGAGASGTGFTPRPNIPRSDTQSAVEYVMDNAENVGTPYAPTDAEYLTNGAVSGLSNERAVQDTDTISWDWGTTGQAKANLSHLGIEDLADPAADRLMGWDDSDGSTKFFTPANGLGVVGEYFSITDPNLSYIVTTAFSQGDFLYFDGTTFVRLPRGVDGQFLRTRGALNLAPDWQNIAGGGDMLRVNNLADLTDFPLARSNIGLGIEDSPQFTDLTLTGDLDVAGNTVLDGTVTINDDVTLTADLDMTGDLLVNGTGEVQGVLTLGAGIAMVSADPVITMTDTDTGAINRISSNNATGSMRLYADLGNTVANSRFYLNVDGVDQVELSNALAAFAVDITVPDEAYGVGWNSSLEVPTKNALYDKIEVLQPLDADLTAIAAFASTGFAARTATDTWAQRSLSAPAAGFSITNPAGIAGNPTFALTNDLAALEGLGSTGFAVRSTTDTWVQRQLDAPAAGFTITNPAGIAGNPTFVLANDLAALEGLGSTGIAVRSAANTWVQRSIAGTANEITATNGDGVSANPTLSLPSALTFTGKTVTGGTFASPTAITGLPDPTNAQDAATKAYVDSVAQGLDIKPSVKCATTGNITLSGEQTLDGILTSASRVLVRAQSTPSQNGIYVSAAGAWARALDFDNWAEVPSAFVFVEEGSTLGNTGWTCTSDAGGTIGSTSVVFSQFSGAGTYTADGSTLQLVGTQFSIVDAELLAIAGLVSAADQAPYFTGSGTAALMTVTTAARTVLDDTTVGAMLTTLGGQPIDASLTAFAALVTAANKGIYFSGADTPVTYDLTAFGRTLGGYADEAAFKAGVNLEAGVDYQAYDAELAAIAGLTSAADKGIMFSGAGTAATYDLSSVARTLLAQTSQANMRTTGLGLGSLAVLSTINGGNWSGTDLALGDGGTGASLAAPGADRIMFYDQSGTIVDWLTATNGVEISTTNLQMTSNQRTREIVFVIDGGGVTITTGTKGYLPIDFACTITQVTMVADQSGAAVVDIWKDTYANFPPVNADSITASATPTITASGVKSQDATLTGWTTSIAAGDVLGFNVDSVTSFTKLTITLKVTCT